MVQRIHAKIQNELQGLPRQRMEELTDLLNALSWEHERQGFIDGFRIGMKLEREVQE